ncbi:MAG TPA: ABC transporter ATP-binding protein [Candidatus Bathyarchaeia archaeon]|nr:ABC transporter ATP-binding protein [Candidatus Bathyarchaeia archaeon]
MNESPLLDVQGLQASYGDAMALWDVSFNVAEKELVVLIGPNGAGKTTTLRSVQGVLKPRSGVVTFKSENITGLRPNEAVTRGIVLVPEGRGLFTRMTVEENLELGAFTKHARSNLQANLDMVYEMFPILKERRRQKAGSLSGGEQQMLAIGRGLMSQPQLIMLDEPCLGLAPIVVMQVFEALEQLKQKLSVLIVEQNVEAALSVADRAYLLENGRIVLKGKPDDLRNTPLMRESYLGL